VGFTEEDHVVQAFPPDRANEPLRAAVLPRRTWRDWPIADADGTYSRGSCLKGYADACCRRTPFNRSGMKLSRTFATDMAVKHRKPEFPLKRCDQLARGRLGQRPHRGGSREAPMLRHRYEISKLL
jgi:hypothetical protein